MGLLLLMGGDDTHGFGLFLREGGGFGDPAESLGSPRDEIPTQELEEGERTWLCRAMSDSALLTLQSLQL